MRKSVLTGLFACSLVFVGSSVSASAASQEQTNQSNEPTVVELLALETNRTLIVLADSDELALKSAESTTAPIEQPTEIKHVVAENESLSDIATLHATTWNRIFDKNTTIENPDVISVGMELVIPAADEVLAPRELPQAPVPAAEQQIASRKSTTQPEPRTTATRGSSTGNGYVAGYCTWYVKNRRPDMPNNLGNAATWVSRAAAQGMATGSTPAVGAVGQRGNHVVYVESVNADGTVTISEMNHKGLYVETTRTLPASYFSYIY